ncbi:hypothetical protein FSP39_023098, partial [Pinctada imbricata]
DDHTDDIVEECWRIIEDQCKEYVTSVDVKQEERKAWQTVRVFVSSTFSDFFSEREILVKKVFPELREWCEGRKLQLVECDLRWGVPKDFTDEQTIRVCMEEIDRCFEQNQGKPFFIGMLGERYGWIPELDNIPEDMCTKYDWVPNTSITCMEMLHGAYRYCNPNAAFFIRNSKVLDEIPHDHVRRFQDSASLSQKQLEELKRRLRLKFPKQVFDYSCNFDGIKEQSGRKRVHLSDFENFSEHIISFLKSAIQRTYPLVIDLPVQSEDEIENEQHEDFILRKAEMVVGRDELLDNLMSYTKGEDLSNLKIKGEEKAFVRDPVFWDVAEGDEGIMVVTGPVGYGKSSILAKHIQTVQKTGMSVFYHFVGSSSSSYHTINICKRFAQQLTGERIETPENESDLIKFYMKKIKAGIKSLSNNGRQLLIVLDGLNEIIERQGYSHLSWLPPSFPSNIKCIVSSADDHLPTTHRLKEHPCFVLQVPLLSVGESREMIRAKLHNYGKKLDGDQLETIVSQPCSQNPLWLWLLSERLRVFGDFRGLDDRIKLVSTSLDTFLWFTLTRIIEDDRNCRKFLCLLGVSQNGIPTNDMKNLLGDVTDKEPLPLLYWASLRRVVLPYIRIMGTNETIKVESLLLSEEGECERWHQYMVDYYLHWCLDNKTKLDNIPYHCKAANLKAQMLTFMRKHQISFHYSGWLRSNHLQMCRCKNMADPIIPAVRPVVLCQRCSNSTGSFFPLKSSVNKNSCIICGSHLFPNSSDRAYTCLQHSGAQSKTSVKCLLCNMIVWLDDQGNIKQNMGSFGLLCQHCSFGQNRKRCSAICDK